MVFEPSKTTKSLGLKDPKVLDAEIQGAALAEAIKPLTILNENFITVNWNKMNWSQIGPIIACISEFYLLEEDKGRQLIFKGLNESYHGTGDYLSFEDFVKVTKCENVSEFYFKHMNVSEVYPKLFQLVPGGQGRDPLGILSADYFETCTKLSDDCAKLTDNLLPMV